MTLSELEKWKGEFFAFHARFASLFARSEPRTQCAEYLRGLLSEVDRKNGWHLAEAVGEATPDSTERLLYSARWDADLARDRLRAFVVETLGQGGIGVVDETGFLKKGTESVGVKRQYTGTAGKVDNAQVGTFLSYVTERGHAFLDRRLYLPEDWSLDPERRRKAKVPEEVSFATKPEQARSMLEQAWTSGVEMPWVTGDEVYGSAPALREAIAQSGRCYVLAVRTNEEVWASWPPLEEPFRETGGRPRTKARVSPEADKTVPVSHLVESWPEAKWERLAVAEGEKGPRIYDWGRMRVVEPRGGLPHRWAWLLARRSVSDPSEVAYYLSNGTEQADLRRLAEVASARYTVEQCIQEAKGQTGLDHYQVRYWHSWHRHITLSMMAHAFLVSLQAKTRETSFQEERPPREIADLPEPNTSGKKGRARPLKRPSATKLSTTQR